MSGSGTTGPSAGLRSLRRIHMAVSAESAVAGVLAGVLIAGPIVARSNSSGIMNTCEWIAKNAQKPIKGNLKDFLRRFSEVYGEYKVDGTRVFVFIMHLWETPVVMYSRHNGKYTIKDYPEVFQVLDQMNLPDYTILDGELVRKTGILYLFDTIFNNNEDVRYRPLLVRKALLPYPQGPVQVLKHTRIYSESDTEKLFKESLEQGFEGYVLKANTPYNRPSSWLKRKNFESIDVFVTGFKETDATRERGEIWTYHIAVYADGKVVDIGDASSCIEGVDRSQIKIGTVLEVSHQPTEGFKRLRHPTILKIREDKLPEECSVDQLRPRGYISNLHRFCGYACISPSC